MTDFYEPWAPRVGDRVRWVPNPECPHCSQYLDPEFAAREFVGTVGTIDYAPIVGTIDEVYDSSLRACQGHNYRMHADRKLRMKGLRLFGEPEWVEADVYIQTSAAELEPV